MQLVSTAQVQPVASGSQVQQTSTDRFGALLVSELHARYANVTLNGLVFRATGAPYTIVVTTDISPMPATTGVTILGLYNPTNSGKNAVLLRHACATTSGTPGGPILWNYITGTTTAIAGTVTPVNCFLSAATSAMTCFGSSATSPAFSVAGKLFGVAAAASAVATTGQGGLTVPVYEEDAGDIIIPPGAFLGMLATAAGTSHIVVPSMEWAEVPI